ncbi:hypothetical protein Cci01nite_19490 [Catellatospora citrea]|uniref:Uncharacterized protein n=1 Tax=Catellatospora citrea TaxID=53366 RepID=A0A8J3KGR6_9ACTN|nr:hypothetical protein Cci01nite_19490 [Catellatospora citrea]
MCKSDGRRAAFLIGTVDKSILDSLIAEYPDGTVPTSSALRAGWGVLAPAAAVVKITPRE